MLKLQVELSLLRCDDILCAMCRRELIRLMHETFGMLFGEVRNCLVIKIALEFYRYLSFAFSS